MLSTNTLFLLLFVFSYFFVLKVNVTKIGKEAKMLPKKKNKEIGDTGLVENKQYEPRKEQ